MSYNNRGNAYSSRKQYDLAIADFSKAAELDPKDFISYINRADAYSDIGQIALAVKDLNLVIEQSDNPNFVKIARDKLGKLK